MIKKTLLVAALSVSMGIFAAPVLADTIIRIAPPPPRAERVPEPRRGHVWTPGHWDWQGKRYVWVRGDWIPERSGYAYAPTRWYERDGRWVQERGRWNRTGRDRDGDGVQNRNDSHPANPRRN